MSEGVRPTIWTRSEEQPMSDRPADLYLSLHDDGPVAATVAPGRRVAALLFAVLLLMAVPLVWLSADAVATTGAKATLASHDDDDSSGSGDGDDDGTRHGRHRHGLRLGDGNRRHRRLDQGPRRRPTRTPPRGRARPACRRSSRPLRSPTARRGRARPACRRSSRPALSPTARRGPARPAPRPRGDQPGAHAHTQPRAAPGRAVELELAADRPAGPRGRAAPTRAHGPRRRSRRRRSRARPARPRAGCARSHATRAHSGRHW